MSEFFNLAVQLVREQYPEAERSEPQAVSLPRCRHCGTHARRRDGATLLCSACAANMRATKDGVRCLVCGQYPYAENYACPTAAKAVES